MMQAIDVAGQTSVLPLCSHNAQLFSKDDSQQISELSH